MKGFGIDDKSFNSERWQRLWKHFDVVLASTLNEREGLLSAIKNKHPDLFPELTDLIISHLTSSSILDKPMTQISEATPLPKEIAGFQIKKLLGSGGLADVYQASKQQELHERLVAIKLVNAGREASWVVESFQNELQFLFDLNHPNIERLYEGGIAADGIPYLVVEYIQGEHVDKYCDNLGLGLEGRISLFQQICQAVAVMHQSLMIHRDIKPSNVMVDSGGTAKLFDFGLAKLVQTKGEEPDFSDMMMTVAYASPEQKASQHLTTASDVYALGLLLFQLLSGTKPSVLLKQQTNTPQWLASQNINQGAAVFKYEPKLQLKLKPELDWIVKRCTEVDAKKRYGSAQQLLDDINRYLNNEPIKAKPNTVSYRMKKFTQRHQFGVVSFTVFFIAIMLLMSLLFHRTHELTQSLQSVEAEKNRVNQVTQFLIDVFNLTDPIKNQQGKSDVKSLLDYSAKQLDAQFFQEPEIKSTLYQTLGTVYLNMSDIENAATMLDKAVRLDETANHHIAVILARVRLLEKKGELQAAWDMLATFMEEALEPLNHPDWLKTQLLKGQLLYQMNDLTHAKNTLMAVLSTHVPTNNTASAQTIADINYLLGSVHWKLGDMAQVSSYYGLSYESNLSRLGASHHATLKSQSAKGVLAYTQGDFEQALSMFQSVLEKRQNQLGPLHDLTADAHNRLGATWYELGKSEVAESHYRNALAAFEANGLNQSLKFARVLNNLGLIKRLQQRSQEASHLFKQALEIQSKLLGVGHPNLAAMMNNLGLVAYDQSEFQQALLWFERALKIQQSDQHDLHVNAAYALTNMGHMQIHLNQPAHAEKHIKKALELRKSQLGETHLLYAASLVVVAELYLNTNRFESAVNSFEVAFDIRKNQLKKNDWRVIELRLWLHLLGSAADVQNSLDCDWQSLRGRLGEFHPKVIALVNKMNKDQIKLNACEVIN